ncbi:MAG: penicillin acylase family protein [Gammaproteobacteria bacterium]|nr:penicillin acylase family protein [Gammaproteobacteria bacterium]
MPSFPVRACCASRRLLTFGLTLLLVAVGCGGGGSSSSTTASEPPAAPEPRFSATIRRTEYGIPHIRAEDWGSLGYGYGYAYAQDQFCTAMRGIVAATSRSAELLGEADGDPVTDFVLRFLFGEKDDFSANFLPDADSDAHRLVEGFALGMNRHLREKGAEGLPGGDSGCRDADWVQEIDAVDLWMLIGRLPLQGGSDLGLVRRAIYNTKGPSSDAAAGLAEADQDALIQGLGQFAKALRQPGQGSNALAVGGDLSQTGKGLLLGNPHRSWTGEGSFYQVHLTLPGEYDVAGAALQGLPWVGIGFNGDLAWTHTTSFATRFTLYELELNPSDLMQYRYDGEWRDITTEAVAIQVRLADGSLEERTHTFYRSHFGPIVNLKELSPLFGTWPLANGTVLAFRDANALRAEAIFDQYRRMGRAADMDDFTDALKSIATPVFHTLAADRRGEAFYGEVAPIPHVTQAQLDGCLTRIGRLLAGLANNAALVLDGSDPDCEWGEDADSPGGTNLYGFEARPLIRTRDYVGNSNDSYWLSNPGNPLTGYPLVFGWLGGEGQQQMLRTRIGHLMAEQRRNATDGLDSAPGFTLESLKGLMFRNRVFAAEITVDDVLALCAALPPDTADEAERRSLAACEALAGWDRTADVDSRGTQVFHEFWRGIRGALADDFTNIVKSDRFWAVDFDPAEPLGTPRGIDRSQSSNRTLVIDALSEAVLTLEEAGIALDAPWGDVQFAARNNLRIPLHGADGDLGVYGAISSRLEDGGYLASGGNSHLQAVTWDDGECPIAETLLVPSQSSDPDSPHFADQTELYSRKAWVRFPYCEADISAAQIGETVVVEE